MDNAQVLHEIARISALMQEAAAHDKEWMTKVLIEGESEGVVAMATEIDRLKKANRRIHDENSLQQSRFLDVTQRCNKATARVHELTERQKKTSREGGERQKEKEMADLVMKIEQQMAEAARNKAKADEQIAALAEKLSLVKGDATAWKAKNAELEERLTEVNTRLNSTHAHSTKKMTQIKEQTEQISELKSTIAKSEAWVGDVSGKLEALTKMLGEAEKGKMAAEDRALRTEKELVRTEKSFEKTESALHEVVVKHEKLEQRHAEAIDQHDKKWQRLHSEHLEEKYSLEAEYSKVKEEKEVLAGELSSTRSKLAALESNYDERTAALRVTQGERLGGKDEEIADLQATVARLTQDLTLTRREREESSGEVITLRTTVSTLTGQLEQAEELHKADLHKYNLDSKQLKKDLQQAHEQKSELEGKVKELTQAHAAMEVGVASLEEALEDKERDEGLAVEAFEEELAGLEGEKEEALAQVASLQQQLLTLKLSLADTGNKIGNSSSSSSSSSSGGMSGLMKFRDSMDDRDNKDFGDFGVGDGGTDTPQTDGGFRTASNSPLLTPSAVVEEEEEKNEGLSGAGSDSGQSTVSSPLLFIRLGAHCLSVSLWDRQSGTFVPCVDDIPVIAATAKSTAARDTILASVRLATGSQVDTFSDFLNDGCLVGKDAHYALYDHPDHSLRGNLVLEQEGAILGTQDGHVNDPMRLSLLLRHAVKLATSSLAGSSISASGSSSGGKVWDGDMRRVRVAFGFKATYYEEIHLKRLAESALEAVDHLYLLPSHRLSLSLASFNYAPSPHADIPLLHSCLMVDIGARRTTVVPIYEQIAFHSGVRSCAVGGETLTEALELMLHANERREFAQCTARRRALIARAVKEQHAYVAADFDEEIEDHGSFEFVEVDVGLDGAGASSHHKRGNKKKKGDGEGDKIEESLPGSAYKRKGGTPGRKGDRAVPVKASVRLPDGSSVSFSLGAELYYCTEELFHPGLLQELLAGEKRQGKGKEMESGLADVLLQAVEAVDESVRDEVCSTIVLLGGTAHLRGLKERLQRAVGPALASLGVPDTQMVVGDAHLMDEGANLLLHHAVFSRHTREISPESYAADGGDLHEVLL